MIKLKIKSIDSDNLFIDDRLKWGIYEQGVRTFYGDIK